MNKYLIKIAVVNKVIKELRRVKTMALTGSHDFHGTKLKKIPSILKDGRIVPGNSVGHDLHGKNVYLGKGSPASGYEPHYSTGQIAVPKSSKRITTNHDGEHFSLSKNPVDLRSSSGKTYVSIPKRHLTSDLGKKVQELARTSRVRVVSNETVNSEFSKSHSSYDPWGVSKHSLKKDRLRRAVEKRMKDSNADYLKKHS